jgi:glycosyl transferase-like sugar-binding protein
MIIYGLWIGNHLSDMERLSIESFLYHKHDFHLYTYGPVQNVPPGTRVLDANEILSRDKVERFKYTGNPSYSAFSNVFRYKLLLEKGGIWVDLDVICLRKFDIGSDYLFPMVNHQLMLGRDNLDFDIDAWFIKVPTNSELMKFCYETACQYEGHEMSWGTIGPALLRDAVCRFGLQRFASHWDFFPINWSHYREFVSGSILATVIWHLFCRKALVIHLYHEVWRQNGLDKNGTFDRNSIYERLKARYLRTGIHPHVGLRTADSGQSR